MNKIPKSFLISDAACLLLFIYFLYCLPRQLFTSPTSYVIEASNGHLLSASIAQDQQWRFPVADSVPQKFKTCIIAFEDKRFYTHFGLDIIAFSRAIRQNIRAKQVISGGSTLSMQVIRLSRNKPRTIKQKIIEILLACRLEFRYSKEDILKLYAANAPFGSNVVGLEAASWRYYGRTAETLSWGETATLAVLPNSPALIHPGKNSSKLIKKRNDLLDKLCKMGFIDQTTASLSKLEPIPQKPLALPQSASHLLSLFKNQRGKLHINNTKITSTLQEDLQLKTAAILKRYNYRYRANSINNVSALILDVKSGNVISYVGNAYEPENAELQSYVDMIQAPRSPGSVLKPLLYASMLNDGYILPKTLIPDIPTQIAGYTPENYNLGYDGAIPADIALSRSLNIPAVRMLQMYKYARFYDKLKLLGFSTLNQPADHYGLSLILGGSEITQWDLASTYMGLARTLNHYNTYKGLYNTADYGQPNYVKNHIPAKGNEEASSFFDHGSIWATFNAMEEVVRPGEEGLWEQFSSSERIAWKTGTSFGFRDAWAIGLNPQYVVCVWVGNADGEGRPGLTGIETAAPILFDLFKLLPTGKWFEKPKTKLQKLRVCKKSGYKAGEYCEEIAEELVPPRGLKTQICPYHKQIHLDRTGQFRVTDACESIRFMLHKKWFILPPAMEYYYKIKNSDYKPLPPFLPACQNAEDYSAMELIYPKNGAKIYIPLEIDGKRGKLILNAAHRNANNKIYWHIDNEYVGTTVHYHQLEVRPYVGKHTLTLVDEKGERLTQVFSILAKDK
ncbi:penicillin-binding protein 1C [Pedobacter sp. MW01-1-1]|uniref:penicillin-binding protein 1C n=1 Tax=Pedobacter sp. MW01-1-1 TaxID=3383027 RepID=UPI003FF09F03